MEDVAQILHWYILNGVDEICADTPLNALVPQSAVSVGEVSSIQNAVPQRAQQISSSAVFSRPATTLLAQDNSGACVNAREICAKSQTLAELKKSMESFEGCSLKFSANSTVFGYGNPKAEVMLIGEAPGADEDMAGEPFVGRSGHLLTKMLQAIKINREDCYITNVLPWRPPGNRTPTDGEVAVCLPFLKRQIELVKPKYLFLLGGSAANALLENNESISHLRGKFIDYTLSDGTIIPTLASFHPAYLLRSPLHKARAWSDFMRLQRKMQGMAENSKN